MSGLALAGAGRDGGAVPRRHVVPGAALAALAAGVTLVVAGLLWAPARDNAQVLAAGARIYAEHCTGCHGARLEGQAVPRQAGPAAGPPAPRLDEAGHAWRHADAQLYAILAHGSAGEEPGMPGFAERLGPEGIIAVLTYVKSHWPAGARAHQAALSRDEALAALFADATTTLPSQCLSPPD
jgi:S-disulfanyl-L-cysteine oxidoreductase SoxD